MGRHVLVTVGTTSFDGLITAVDSAECQRELARLGYTDICYQLGTSSLEIRQRILRTRVVRFVREFEGLLRESDLVISHMGGGTIIEVFRLRKKALFVPNPAVSGNHQMQLFGVMDERFRATLSSLCGRLACAAETPGEFFDRLLPASALNSALDDLLSS